MSDISIATLQARAMRVELERDSARAELADCQRRAGVMRRLLESVKEVAPQFLDDETGHFSKAVDEALKPDAGRGWVKLNWRPGTEVPQTEKRVICETTSGIEFLTKYEGRWGFVKCWLYANELLESK